LETEAAQRLINQIEVDLMRLRASAGPIQDELIRELADVLREIRRSISSI
jgi:hypothetical protein